MASRVFQSSLSLSKIPELWRDTSALKGAFEEGDLSAVAAKLQTTLHLLENARLDIGITGGTGLGKSTFVNTIRGLGDEDPKSAYTGVVEMTVGPTPYAHPKYPNVIIWDLPGISTPTFQAEKYLQRVLPARYDFFIIITSQSFTAHHAQLAREILQLGKHFYLIRSEVDVDIAASRSRRPSTFSEERVLSQIWEDCWRRLEGEGQALGGWAGWILEGPPAPSPSSSSGGPQWGKGSSNVTLRDPARPRSEVMLTAAIHFLRVGASQSQDPKVFLLSMFELGKYDFHLLEEVMAKDLESHKRHVLLLAMPSVSEPVLERKAASLRQLIWLVAAVACGVNPSPVPGVQDVVCDLHMLIDSLEGYRRSFGLDKDSLVTLAGQTGQPLHKILEAARGPKTVTEALVVELLGQASRDASAFTQELLNVPVLGTLATCGLSFATIYQMLCTSLDEAVKDAQRVLLQAFLDNSDHELPERSDQ
uniref:interferon-inducible GTPase 5-like n=1 Tax=Halichoerus grypus TaxID=9711 RepID=UPI001659C81E|nr:interferon-inducible GTPase 5-like [Halichoerus grypus]